MAREYRHAVSMRTTYTKYGQYTASTRKPWTVKDEASLAAEDVML